MLTTAKKKTTYSTADIVLFCKHLLDSDPVSFGSQNILIEYSKNKGFFYL
jgi:hypothetical protein